MSSSPSSISDTVTLSRGCTDVHSFLLDPGSSRFSIKDEQGGDSLQSRARRIKQLNGNISHSFAQQHISYYYSACLQSTIQHKVIMYTQPL